jgi:branched-chain amino acid transport system ATP-binding protein
MELVLKDIYLTYSGKRDADSQLLKGINLQAEKGKVTALVGGNGAGKTTLFNIISGFEKGFQGQVLLDGKDISRLPVHRIARKGVGRLFQGRQLMDDLTLLENLKIGDDDHTGEDPFDALLSLPKAKAGSKSLSVVKNLIRILGKGHTRKLLSWLWRVVDREAVRERKAKDILARLFGAETSLLAKLDNQATDLSYGEQRLVALARLLMGGYPLLLLDEPTSGVNSEYIRSVGQAIREMADRDGTTVFLIDHNLDFVRSVADRCCYLKDGKIFKSGTPGEVLDDWEIRKDYVGL